MSDDQDPAETVLPSAGEAFRRGDHVFQYTEAAWLEKGYAAGRYGRPFKAVQELRLVNGICREGWELLDASVSRWESGNSAYMMGFYTFRRCEENRPISYKR